MLDIRPATERDVADFYLDGQPMLCLSALAFFLVKHYAAWQPPRAPRRLHLADFETWDRVGDRVGHRLGLHLWHPDHFAAVPDPDQTASIRSQARLGSA